MSDENHAQLRSTYPEIIERPHFLMQECQDGGHTGRNPAVGCLCEAYQVDLKYCIGVLRLAAHNLLGSKRN